MKVTACAVYRNQQRYRVRCLEESPNVLVRSVGDVRDNRDNCNSRRSITASEYRYLRGANSTKVIWCGSELSRRMLFVCAVA